MMRIRALSLPVSASAKMTSALAMKNFAWDVSDGARLAAALQRYTEKRRREIAAEEEEEAEAHAERAMVDRRRVLRGEKRLKRALDEKEAKEKELERLREWRETRAMEEAESDSIRAEKVEMLQEIGDNLLWCRERLDDMDVWLPEIEEMLHGEYKGPSWPEYYP